MKNHPLYKRLKQIVLDGDYTIEQVKNMRWGQAAELLDCQDFSKAFLNNMKRGIVDALRNRDDKATLEQLKEDIKAYLDANDPHWEAERGREGGKPYVKIWLEGKPGE